MTNEQLAESYQAGDKEAMEQIIKQNEGLVVFFINQFHSSLENSYLEWDDLKQLGNIGLMMAVKSFDPSLGYKFSSYASKAIKSHVFEGIMVSTPWIRRRDTKGQMATVVSSNKLSPQLDNVSLEETIPDKNADNAYYNLIDQMDRDILRRDLIDMLGKVFNDRDKVKDAFILFYGLNDAELTAREIGELYDEKQGTVSSWITTGLRKIRRSKAGIELKRKYALEYNLEAQQERLSKLAFKDPLDYAVEHDRWRNGLMKLLENVSN